MQKSVILAVKNSTNNDPTDEIYSLKFDYNSTLVVPQTDSYLYIMFSIKTSYFRIIDMHSKACKSNKCQNQHS